MEGKAKLEKATFAAGCFWGVEETFRTLPGVKSTQAGYSGGSKANPIYGDVCTGRTGHAEAVEIEFDPKQIPYKRLVEIFFSTHDPTQVNRQGQDVGTQYRTAIFYHSTAQKKIAEGVRKAVAGSGAFAAPIATEILPAGKFWKAEGYHQKYLMKRGEASCRI